MAAKKGKKKGKGGISKKLDRLIAGQEKLFKEEEKIELKEEETGKKETEELNELKKLERIEKEVEQEVREHPLTKVTIRDVFKGSLGAFVGIILHYTVIYGVEIAKNITMAKATFLYALTFIMGMVFLYITGFRKVTDKSILIFLPVRTIVLYSVSIIISAAALYFFFPTFGQSFEEAYKQVATVSLTAVIGACTADILGKD